MAESVSRKMCVCLSIRPFACLGPVSLSLASGAPIPFHVLRNAHWKYL